MVKYPLNCYNTYIFMIINLYILQSNNLNYKIIDICKSYAKKKNVYYII